MLNPMTPPETVCLLRLSAIGDTCHVVPIVRALQRAWPATRLTWVIGRIEARLMSVLPDVEFITIDKRASWRSWRAMRAALHGRHFDVLLHMQLSWRASMFSRLIRARRRIGYDRERARELQWLFTNEHIEPRGRQHVLDTFVGFANALGIDPHPLRWDLPLPPDALEYAAALIPDHQPTLVISPCSSHAARNWRAERYAAVADHAARRHGMRVILCGGRSAAEQQLGAAIQAAASRPLRNQIGQDTLPQLLALLARATVLLSPDSGPAHMATMVKTPVIGLYAATRSVRCGPYESIRWCIDRYEQAAQRYRGRTAAQMPWSEKIEVPGVMDLIEVPDVTARLDALLATPPDARVGPVLQPATIAP